MKCDKITDKLSLYLDKALSDKEAKIVAEHLRECMSCQKELESLKATMALFASVKPVVKMPYPKDDFLVSVRRKIRTQDVKAPRPSFLPRLIPAFSGALMILLAVVFINNYQENQRNDTTILVSDALNEEETVSSMLAGLDEISQNAVAGQMVEDISDTDLASLENEVALAMETDDLISNLSENEQEIFINQIQNEYDEAQAKINPDWIFGESSPASSGGQNG